MLTHQRKSTKIQLNILIFALEIKQRALKSGIRIAVRRRSPFPTGGRCHLAKLKDCKDKDIFPILMQAEEKFKKN